MKRSDVRAMSRMALVLALIILLEFFESSILRMPQGGSISLASLMFLLVLPLFNKTESIVLFLSWRLLRLLLMPPFFVSVSQLLLDYVVAYVGFLLVYPLRRRDKRSSLVISVLLANVWRYVVHVTTGTFYFGSYAGEQAVVIYSLIYNLSYIGPTIIVQLLVGNLLLPVIKNLDKQS